MITVTPGTLGELPIFDVLPSNPNYWMLRWAYEECLTRYNQSQAGIGWHRVEVADISAAESVVMGSVDNLVSWLQAASVAANAGQDVPEIAESYWPELAELALLIATGQFELIFVLFVKAGLKWVLSRLKERFDTGTVDDVAAKIDEIFIDKTDPANIVNRLAELLQVLQTITPPSIEVDGMELCSIDY